MPGDAVLAIDGTDVTSFPQIQAFVAYLRSIEPVAHATPESVCAEDEDVPVVPVEVVDDEDAELDADHIAAILELNTGPGPAPAT